MEEPEARFEFLSVTYEKPRQRFAMGLGAFAVSAFACILAGGLTGPIGFIVALVAAFVAAPRAVDKLAGTKTATNAESVFANGELRIPAIHLAVKPEDVKQGIESGADGNVLLDLADGEMLRLVCPPNEDSAARLLERLGVGAGQRTTTVPLRRQLGRFTIGLVTFFLGLLPAGILSGFLARVFFEDKRPLTIPLMFLMSALTIWPVLKRFGRPHVVIGADGIRIRGMLSQPFYRYSDIERVQALGWYLVLHLANGEEKTLPIISVDQTRVSGLVKRIEQARKRASDGRTFLTDSLARAGRTAAEWRSSLERLAKREATFREAPLDRDEVARVATDPDVNAEQRVAAAFVLTRIDAEDGKTRIRVAADATADEELKLALLAAAEGEMESEAVGRVMKRR